MQEADATFSSGGLTVLAPTWQLGWGAAKVDNGGHSEGPAPRGGVWSSFLRSVTYIILYLRNPLSRQQ